MALCFALALATLALVRSLEHDRPHGHGELLAEVDVKAAVTTRAKERTRPHKEEGTAGNEKGSYLAGHSALRQLGLQPRPGCQHLTNLVHSLQRSRTNVSTEEVPLSYMHIDHPVYQVGLAVFDLFKAADEVLEVLDEDASASLQPFLQDVSTWREACAPNASVKDQSDRDVLLVLPRHDNHSESSWEEMAREFAAYVARKTLRKRPHEVQVWPTDGISLGALLSKDQGCFRSVAVLSGEPWNFTWSQHYRCNVQEGRLMLRFVEHFMQRNPVQLMKNASDSNAPAQVCLSKGDAELMTPLELCELAGRTVQVKVAPTAADMAFCDAFLAFPSARLTGAEFWLRNSTSLVEILPKNKAPTILMENLALLTGAKRFTVGSAKDSENEADMAARIILALNRAGVDAADGSLDDSISGVGELEGCEEFYHPSDGWLEGWRDVARSLKLARKNEGQDEQLESQEAISEEGMDD